MPPLPFAFRDDFNNNNLGSPWGTYGSGVSETNSRIEMVSQLASTYSGINTGATGYDFTGREATIQFLGPFKSTLVSLECYPLILETTDGQNRVLFLISPQGNTLRAFHTVTGVSTELVSITLNENKHRFFHLRELNGTTIWETSPDGVARTRLYQEANAITMTALRPNIQLGTYNVELSQVTGLYDNFNVLPQIRRKMRFT